MNIFKTIFLGIIAVLVSNVNILPVSKFILVPLAILVAFLMCGFIKNRKLKIRKLKNMENGCYLLEVFLITLSFNAVYYIALLLLHRFSLRDFNTSLSLLIVALFTVIIFIRGIVKIYLRSTQLGIKHRVLAVVFAFIPGLNLYYLIKMIRIVLKEVSFENDKIILNESRELDQICKTKYPLLMVHGVFFRDFRYLDYWGRIPKELKQNGATVFYGKQQSAASVDECGKELAEHIQQICEETGCKKVNIIGHSKGGLDSRAAISKYGADRYVASLSTINTPHRGCLFAEALLDQIPEIVKTKISGTYNAVLSRMGDQNPDFMAAVLDLTNKNCMARNKELKDNENVLYESYTSYCKKRTSGKFPLNISYNVVKKHDGINDGLVAIDSAKWGTSFTLIEPKHNRGISHGDMIDLNRENIEDFDVREFYVQLVASLKTRGY